MRLRNPANVDSRRGYRTLRVMEALRAAGCRILDSHAHAEPPTVRVDRRPAHVDTWGFRPPPPGCVPLPVLCVADCRGVRVEWIAPQEERTCA